MSDTLLKVTEADLTPVSSEDRFQRFSLMGWWDQKRIRDAKVLVIGAGALGNEIVKNLSLLGFGHVLIADLDNIENSNLSRSILYRARDNGSSKAITAAQSAKDIFPDIKVNAFHGNVIYDLGLGVYNWADLVIAGLDNREARLSINRNCWKVNKPWIDGAIEQISGVARVFVPDGPCYECTMSEIDWQLLNRRRSCNLLTKDEMQEGKVPTTPTISSIIAGVQCQEAVKLIHGMECLAGKGFVFNGVSADSYIVEYQRKEDCYSHDTAQKIYKLGKKTCEVEVGELLSIVRKQYGTGATLELSRDVLHTLTCPSCGKSETLNISLGNAKYSLAACPNCGVRRNVETVFAIDGTQDFLTSTFAGIGVSPFDIIWARTEQGLIGFEFSGDEDAVLGGAK